MPHWLLLPGSTDPARPGLTILKDIPGDLRPRIDPTTHRLEARSFPTPFALAETLGMLLLRGVKGDPMIEKYRRLVLGVVLGHLEVTLVDLAERAGKLGKAMARVEPDTRYFGFVRGKLGDTTVSFGGTHPRTLFWPSPRRSDGDWEALHQKIQGDTRLPRALELLADARESLAAVWDPRAVPWMKALELVASSTPPSPGLRVLASDARLVGPFQVAMPVEAGDPEGRTQVRRLYFPVLEPGFARQILEMCTLRFRPDGGRGAIVALDPGDQIVFRILTPSVAPGADPLLAGAGTIVRESGAGAVGVAARSLRLLGEDGLFTHLGELLAQIAIADGGATVDQARILRNPLAYPDVLRIPARAADPASKSAPVVFSDEAQRRMRDGASLPTLDALRTVGSGAGVLLEWGTGPDRRAAAWIESNGELDFGDLRAVGSLLFAYFTGEASLYQGKLPIRDAHSLAELSKSSSERPIDATDAIYARIVDGGAQRDASLRLGSLQRFVATYRERAGGEDRGAQLALAAAEAFARWAWGGPVAPLGARVTRVTRVDLPSGHVLPLVRDALAEEEG